MAERKVNKMNVDFTEKRKYPRFDFRIPMRYRKIETDTYDFKGSLIKNISKGGVKMTIYEFLPLNLRLAVEIPLTSGTQPVKGVCRVVWVRKTGIGNQYDVGVEFVNLNQGDPAQIARFIFNKSEGKVLWKEESSSF